MKLILPLAIASVAALSVYAADDDLSPPPQYDKSAYNLFQRLPSDLMRPINSEVYDNVIDAHTLDSGHVQLDTALVDYYKGSGDVSESGVSLHHSEEAYTWMPRVRVGVLNNVELDLEVGYTTSSQSVYGQFNNAPPPGTFHDNTSRDAFGNIFLGPKINLWGNDSGTTSFALHPYVNLPTDHGDIVGGIDLPFTWNLPGDFYLKLQSGFTVTDDASHTHYGSFYNAVSLHKPLCKAAEAYWYLDSNVTDQHGTPWFGYTGIGMIYKATSNFQLYGGMGFGLNSESYDYNPRFGLIYRF